MKRLLSLALALALVCALLTSFTAIAEDSDFTYIENSLLVKMGEEGYNAATLTMTDELRGAFVVMAQLDFLTAVPDYQFDYTQPVYVGQTGSVLTLAFSGQDEYVVMLTDFTAGTMYTTYALPATLVKTTLDSTCDTVWEVSLATIATVASSLSDSLNGN